MSRLIGISKEERENGIEDIFEVIMTNTVKLTIPPLRKLRQKGHYEFEGR